MLISELAVPVRANALYEQIAPHNRTGFLTEDLVNVIMIEQDGAWCEPQTYEEFMMEMGLPAQPSLPSAQPPVVFIRSTEYKKQYLEKIRPYPAKRSSVIRFMDIKRKDPTMPVGNDKPFKPGFFFASAVPGISHAHLAGGDYSLIYRVEGRKVYLYGFYTHDELGTGQPANKRKQESMAAGFAHTQWTQPPQPAPKRTNSQKPKWRRPDLQTG
jgi:hypothetical protein